MKKTYYIPGGQINQNDSDEEQEINDPLKYERDFKDKLMNAEYKKILDNVANIEQFCDNLNDKVQIFNKTVDDRNNEVDDIDAIEQGLTIAEIKDKLKDGKATQTRLKSMKTMHSGNHKCDICGLGHSMSECKDDNKIREFINEQGEKFSINTTTIPNNPAVNNEQDTGYITDRSKNSRGRKDKKVANKVADTQAYEQKKMQYMDPALIKDMMERRRILEQKKKERDWARLSKKEKRDFLEKQAKEKFEVTFKENADKMRTMIQATYAEAKADDSSENTEDDMLKNIDKEKINMKVRMNEQKADRNLILGSASIDSQLNDTQDDRGSTKSLDLQKQKKLEQIKRMHEQMIDDLNNPEKQDEVKKQIDVLQNATTNKSPNALNSDSESGLLGRQMTLQVSPSKKEKVKRPKKDLFNIIENNIESKMEEAILKMEETSKNSVGKLNTREKNVLIERINKQMNTLGAPLITDHAKLDVLIQDYTEKKENNMLKMDMGKKKTEEKSKNTTQPGSRLESPTKVEAIKEEPLKVEPKQEEKEPTEVEETSDQKIINNETNETEEVTQSKKIRPIVKKNLTLNTPGTNSTLTKIEEDNLETPRGNVLVNAITKVSTPGDINNYIELSMQKTKESFMKTNNNFNPNETVGIIENTMSKLGSIPVDAKLIEQQVKSEMQSKFGITRSNINLSHQSSDNNVELSVPHLINITENIVNLEPEYFMKKKNDPQIKNTFVNNFKKFDTKSSGSINKDDVEKVIQTTLDELGTTSLKDPTAIEKMIRENTKKGNTKFGKDAVEKIFEKVLIMSLEITPKKSTIEEEINIEFSKLPAEKMSNDKKGIKSKDALDFLNNTVTTNLGNKLKIIDETTLEQLITDSVTFDKKDIEKITTDFITKFTDNNKLVVDNLQAEKKLHHYLVDETTATIKSLFPGKDGKDTTLNQEEVVEVINKIYRKINSGKKNPTEITNLDVFMHSYDEAKNVKGNFSSKDVISMMQQIAHTKPSKKFAKKKIKVSKKDATRNPTDKIDRFYVDDLVDKYVNSQFDENSQIDKETLLDTLKQNVINDMILKKIPNMKDDDVKAVKYRIMNQINDTGKFNLTKDLNVPLSKQNVKDVMNKIAHTVTETVKEEILGKNDKIRSRNGNIDKLVKKVFEHNKVDIKADIDKQKAKDSIISQILFDVGKNLANIESLIPQLEAYMDKKEFGENLSSKQVHKIIYDLLSGVKNQKIIKNKEKTGKANELIYEMQNKKQVSETLENSKNNVDAIVKDIFNKNEGHNGTLSPKILKTCIQEQPKFKEILENAGHREIIEDKIAIVQQNSKKNKDGKIEVEDIEKVITDVIENIKEYEEIILEANFLVADSINLTYYKDLKSIFVVGDQEKNIDVGELDKLLSDKINDQNEADENDVFSKDLIKDAYLDKLKEMAVDITIMDNFDIKIDKMLNIIDNTSSEISVEGIKRFQQNMNQFLNNVQNNENERLSKNENFIQTNKKNPAFQNDLIQKVYKDNNLENDLDAKIHYEDLKASITKEIVPLVRQFNGYNIEKMINMKLDTKLLNSDKDEEERLDKGAIEKVVEDLIKFIDKVEENLGGIQTTKDSGDFNSDQDFSPDNYEEDGIFIID